jgi:hypothetical protein
MAFRRLEDFEKQLKADRIADAENKARRDLRRVVREVLPKSLKKPNRPKGRSAVGGVSRREVASLRAKATRFLNGEAGLRDLEASVQHTALVILLIDGVLGTEPWRAAYGAHGGLIAANARLRYLENAARLLEDLRRSRGQTSPNDKLLEGVIDAERTEGENGTGSAA